MSSACDLDIAFCPNHADSLKSLLHENIRMLAPRGRELYGEASNRALAATREASKLAVPPEAVARAILHALSARRPRTRYRVGRDAKIGWWASRLLPDRLLDRMTRRTMGQ